jgi:hypothetical protein
VNQREKILAGAVGSIFLLFGGFFGIRSFVLKPVLEVRKNIDVTREKLAKIKADQRAFFAAEDNLKVIGARTFADTVDQAAARSGEILTRTFADARLAESEFTRSFFGPRKLRGAQEIGWNVQGDGPLTNIVHLLYLLNDSPWVHRLEGLSVSAGNRPGDVRVSFSYLTLVLDPAPDVTRKDLAGKLTLDSPDRALLNGIVSRDFFRPYIKRPPQPPVPPPGSPGNPAVAGPPRPPGPESFRVVSLSEWQGQPEIHVRDTAAQRTLRFKVGDEMAGGSVVMIDYRPLPSPSQPGLLSHSRVILRIGSEYWAIERGRSLADKRKLGPAELPTSLARNP